MKGKILVDMGMTAALPLLMGYGLIGEEAHEWIGMAMLLLFLLHLFLNRRWFGALGKGRYSPARIAQLVLNCLILLCMLGCMISGILMSRHLFTFLPEHGGYEWTQKMHILCSFWGFVLMSVHLGTHWGMICSLMQKKWKLSKRGSLYLRLLGYLMAFCGIPAFLRRDFADYLMMRSHFVFFDFSEPLPYFLGDYLLVMALFVMLGYMGMGCLRKRRKTGIK